MAVSLDVTIDIAARINILSVQPLYLASGPHFWISWIVACDLGAEA